MTQQGSASDTQPSNERQPESAWKRQKTSHETSVKDSTAPQIGERVIGRLVQETSTPSQSGRLIQTRESSVKNSSVPQSGPRTIGKLAQGHESSSRQVSAADKLRLSGDIKSNSEKLLKVYKLLTDYLIFQKLAITEGCCAIDYTATQLDEIDPPPSINAIIKHWLPGGPNSWIEILQRVSDASTYRVVKFIEKSRVTLVKLTQKCGDTISECDNPNQEGTQDDLDKAKLQSQRRLARHIAETIDEVLRNGNKEWTELLAMSERADLHLLDSCRRRLYAYRTFERCDLVRDPDVEEADVQKLYDVSICEATIKLRENRPALQQILILMDFADNSDVLEY